MALMERERRRIERFGADVVRLCDSFSDGLETILGDALVSLALYGAIVFDETRVLTDLDFVAVLGRPLRDVERDSVLRHQRAIAEEFHPLGGELDGYYISIDDARRVAMPSDRLRPDLVDDSWPLHCAHLRAGKRIVLIGADPADFVPQPTWAQLEAALDGELDYVVAHLEKYPAYGILNLCRLVASHETHDVVRSKADSALWMKERTSEWSDLIDRALRDHAGYEILRDDPILPSEAQAFLSYVIGRIDRARSAML